MHSETEAVRNARTEKNRPANVRISIKTSRMVEEAGACGVRHVHCSEALRHSRTGEFPSNTDRDRQQSIPNGPADESPDDTWDLPADDRCEEEHIHEDGTPPGFHLYDDWDDWGEGYDDDHFN